MGPPRPALLPLLLLPLLLLLLDASVRARECWRGRVRVRGCGIGPQRNQRKGKFETRR